MSDQAPAPGSVPRVARRTTLLTGTVVVAIGLTVTGLGTIAMLSIAARSMPSPEYADFVVWWTVATLLGTSFGVFEVYLARLLIFEIAGGREPATVTGVLIGRAMVMAGALGAVILAAAPALADQLFSGSLAPVLLLWVFMCLTAMQSLQRGAATGRRNMVAISTQLSTDGLGRAAIVGVLAATGNDSISALALGCCLSVVLSLVAGGRLVGPWLAVPSLRGWTRHRPARGLLIGTAGPSPANNGSVPWLRSTDAVSPHVLGAFAGAVTLSRIPTQFFSAVLSPLLAHLSEQRRPRADQVGLSGPGPRRRSLPWPQASPSSSCSPAGGSPQLSLFLGPDFTLGRRQPRGPRCREQRTVRGVVAPAGRETGALGQ